MFKQILFLNWKSARFGVLPFLVAAFALPILAVQGVSLDPSLPESATIRAAQLLYTLQFWTPVFPGFAFALGTVLALLIWNWDHKGEHVYALTLPLPRSRYVAMKMGAGALLLLVPVLVFWVGSLLATYPRGAAHLSQRHRFPLLPGLTHRIRGVLCAGGGNHADRHNPPDRVGGLSRHRRDGAAHPGRDVPLPGSLRVQPPRLAPQILPGLAGAVRSLLRQLDADRCLGPEPSSGELSP